MVIQNAIFIYTHQAMFRMEISPLWNQAMKKLLQIHSVFELLADLHHFTNLLKIWNPTKVATIIGNPVVENENISSGCLFIPELLILTKAKTHALYTLFLLCFHPIILQNYYPFLVSNFPQREVEKATVIQVRMYTWKRHSTVLSPVCDLILFHSTAIIERLVGFLSWIYF